MVQNSQILTSFRVAMETNIDVIWMPLCWLIKDLLVRSKSFSATLSGKLSLNVRDGRAKQYGVTLNWIQIFIYQCNKAIRKLVA